MASFTLTKYATLTSLRLFSPVPSAQCSGVQMQNCRLDKYCLREERAARKSVTCTASSQEQSSSQEKDVFDRALLALYQKETPTISMLLEEIDQRGRIGEGVEDVSGEPTTEADRREIVKAVVEKHWEEMTEAIIMVLAGYAQASYAEGHTQVAETLEMIREEVLAKSLKQLPPEMQALELLTGMFDQSSEERVNATKELAESGKAGIPQCELPALRTTASQMLEDMEEKRGLIDACATHHVAAEIPELLKAQELLAKLCIVREEIDVAATDLGMYEEGTDYFRLMSTTWRLLPAGNAAFVKELMHVSDENKRRALLTACIKHDFQKDPEDTRLQTWVVQGVRPGRLTNTISAIVANLRQEGVQPDSREYARLQDIKTTAFQLLNEMVS